MEAKRMQLNVMKSAKILLVTIIFEDTSTVYSTGML